MKHINENGRSMVEMLGVLAIIGVLSVGGIAGYSKAMNKYKINKTTDQVSMLVANIRTLFSSQGNYKDLSNANAIKFGVVPEDMIKDGSGSAQTLSNAFGGKVTIESSPARSGTALAGAQDAFVITYAGLSDEACVTILTGDWGSGQASGLIGIAGGVAADTESNAAATAVKGLYVDTDGAKLPTGDSSILTAQPGSETSSTPVSVTNAVTACGGGGAGNSVAWKYY